MLPECCSWLTKLWVNTDYFIISCTESRKSSEVTQFSSDWRLQWLTSGSISGNVKGSCSRPRVCPVFYLMSPVQPVPWVSLQVWWIRMRRKVSSPPCLCPQTGSQSGHWSAASLSTSQQSNRISSWKCWAKISPFRTRNIPEKHFFTLITFLNLTVCIYVPVPYLWASSSSCVSHFPLWLCSFLSLFPAVGCEIRAAVRRFYQVL